MPLTNDEKILFIALADEILINSLQSTDHFTEEEREDIADRMFETYDINAPREIREALIATSRKFYDELKESEGEK